jgi:hypothetical protein
VTTHDLIKRQFENLVEEGRKILNAVGWDGRKMQRNPPIPDYFRFRTAALNLVRRSCGEKSDHYQELKRLAESQDSATNSYYTMHCFGVVEAAHQDFEMGLLFDVRALIAAELLGDFIEQAEFLLTANYHVPAASLAGAVLEDTLRKLCERHDIPLPESTKIDRLNSDLARAEIYDRLTQKRITAIADIRNNADHGHFNKFRREDVDDMVKWIRSFTTKYLQ